MHKVAVVIIARARIDAAQRAHQPTLQEVAEHA